MRAVLETVSALARQARQADTAFLTGVGVAVRLQAPSSILPQLSRYTIMSVLALGLDLGLFLALINGNINPSTAGMISYTAGLTLHYLLSVNYVFDASIAEKSHIRLLGEFVLTGFVGLLITALVISVATDYVGLPALGGKIAAVLTSFIAVFILRRTMVFAARGLVSA
jgi:putative flippase GtrA